MVKPLIAFQKCLKYKSETVHWGRCCKAHVSLFQINLLLKRRSITQEPKPFREDCFILLFSTIYHLFFSYLHSWVEARVKQGFVLNDVSNSRHDSLVHENIAQHPATLAPHCLLWVGEAEVLRTHVQSFQSSHFLHTVVCQSANIYAPQGQLLHHWNNASLNSFFDVVLSVLFMRWNSKGEFLGSRNKCPSGCRTIHHDLTVNEQDKCQAKETVFFVRQQPLTSDTAKCRTYIMRHTHQGDLGSPQSI